MIRHRVNVNSANVFDYTHYCTNKDGSAGQHYYGSVTESHVDFMNDIVTPNFHNRIRKGEIISNPADRYIRKVSYPTSTYSATNGGDPQQMAPSTPVSYVGQGKSYLALAGLHLEKIPFEDIDISSLVSEVKQRCISNIDRTPYQFMEDVAEIRETASFIKHSMRSIHSLTTSFSEQVQKAKIGGNSKRAANLYLQYRFALSPLVQSIDSAYQALTTNRKVKRPLGRATASNSQSSHISGNFTDGPHTYRYRFDRKVDVRCGVLYRDRSPRNDVLDTLGLRAKDVPRTAWAVVPLSFMIDRVVNISNSINGLVNLFDPSLTVINGWCKITDSSVLHLELIAQNSPPWVVEVYADMLDDVKSWSRSNWTPTISDTLPVFIPGKLVSDITSIADLAALISQRARI